MKAVIATDSISLLPLRGRHRFAAGTSRSRGHGRPRCPWLLLHTQSFGVILRIIIKFFLITFETGFRAGFCRFLRRIAALFYDKNGENVPEGCHKELLKKF